MQKRPTTLKLATPLGSWEKTRKVDKALASYAPEIKDDAKYECRALTGKVKASHAPLALALAQSSGRC